MVVLAKISIVNHLSQSAGGDAYRPSGENGL